MRSSTTLGLSLGSWWDFQSSTRQGNIAYMYYNRPVRHVQTRAGNKSWDTGSQKPQQNSLFGPDILSQAGLLVHVQQLTNSISRISIYMYVAGNFEKCLDKNHHAQTILISTPVHDTTLSRQRGNIYRIAIHTPHMHTHYAHTLQ